MRLGCVLLSLVNCSGNVISHELTAKASTPKCVFREK